MSIVASELKKFLSANRPTDNTSTSGGAISTTSKPLSAQFSASAQPYIESDNAGDTMNVTIVGRNSAGEIIQETKALNGTTPVAFTASFLTLHTVTIASAATGTVLVKQGNGGTTRHTFAPGDLVAAILFQRAASDPDSALDYYEKEFFKNTNGTLSLTTAFVELVTPLDDIFEIALAASKDDSVSVANRLTAPAGGLTFVDDGTDLAVPSGNLAAGEAIGVWVKMKLNAGHAAGLPTFTTRLKGNTT